jgi:hypothetical protein
LINNSAFSTTSARASLRVLAVILAGATAFPTLAGDKPPSPKAKKPSSAIVLKRQHVMSLDDFKIHSHAHVERYRRLVKKIYKDWIVTGVYDRYATELGEEVSHLGPEDEELVEAFAQQHDAAKRIHTEDFIKKYYGNPKKNASQIKPISDELYKIYGMTREESGKAGDKIINRLNDIDARVTREFFREHGLIDTNGNLHPKALTLLLLEMIADKVDRGMDPVAAEELGYKGQKQIPGSVYLKNIIKEKLPTLVAHDLEATYTEGYP